MNNLSLGVGQMLHKKPLLNLGMAAKRIDSNTWLNCHYMMGTRSTLGLVTRYILHPQGGAARLTKTVYVTQLGNVL